MSGPAGGKSGIDAASLHDNMPAADSDARKPGERGVVLRARMIGCHGDGVGITQINPTMLPIWSCGCGLRSKGPPA